MNETHVEEVVLDVNEQIQQRRKKLEDWRKEGIAYPSGYKRTHLAACLHGEYEQFDNEALIEKKIQVKMAGRMMTRRMMGKASFINLRDMSGQMQVYLKTDQLPEGVYEQFKLWDLGDIVGVQGYVFKTKTGELSLHAENIELLTKALRPLPDKYHGLNDQEVCYRQRYLDLMVNQKTRDVFLIRSKLIQEIRNFLLKRKFLEVETPMMHVIPGGAAARPFETYHNTLDMPLFLRIAPELYLKRLVVGGFEQVFEINRNFRNEGLSTRHNPEFTMLEFYQAYADYHDLMNLTEDMLKYLAESVLGKTKVIYQDQEYDFGKPFERISVLDSILKYNPTFKHEDLVDMKKIRAIADALEIPIKPEYGLGKLQIEVFEKTVEHRLIGPVFITEYPAEVSPLARSNDKNAFITDRFEFFIGGREIANGFSELNDPDDQRARFMKQVEAHEAGDNEAMRLDEDYVTSLEYGLPPTAGEGIGIDRLAMIFADCPSIRDVILFPHMRPQN